ncbi:hypothetical protein [Symmachiella dynata]|uniref:hypothetical protein n=1 Tax=Symmachiella dynata TaxID=2527995 RepID=UPI0030ECA52C
MKQRILSIFNFSTLKVLRVSRKAIASLCVALLVLVCSEVATRVILTSPIGDGWDYWSEDAAARWLTYDRLCTSINKPDIVIAGDSTAAYGFEPTAFARVLADGGVAANAYNLSALGNFPPAFDASVTDLVLSHPNKQPKVLIIMLARGGFVTTIGHEQTEHAIISSHVIRRARGDFVIGDCFALARIKSASNRLLRWTAGRHLSTLSASDSGFGRRAQRLKNDNNWARSATIPTERYDAQSLDVLRLETLEKCFSKLQGGHTDVVMVVPPSHRVERLRWQNPSDVSTRFKKICDKWGVEIWDFSFAAEFDDGMYNDPIHLNENGAKMFSQILGERYLKHVHSKTNSLVLNEGTGAE